MPFLIDSVMALNTSDRIYLKKLAKNYNKIGGEGVELCIFLRLIPEFRKF